MSGGAAGGTEEEQVSNHCPRFPGSVAATSVVIDSRRGDGGRRHFNSVKTLKPAPKTLNGLFSLLSFPLGTTDSQRGAAVWLLASCRVHQASRTTSYQQSQRKGTEERRRFKETGACPSTGGKLHSGCHSDDFLAAGWWHQRIQLSVCGQQAQRASWRPTASRDWVDGVRKCQQPFWSLAALGLSLLLFR